MMKNDFRVVEDANLSEAWVRAILQAHRSAKGQMSPLVVSVVGFSEGRALENLKIRTAVDEFLTKRGQQSVATVANTIFPESLWNPDQPREKLFRRYQAIVEKLHTVRKNCSGIYFERMISGGPSRERNQLEFAISTYAARRGVRRSALQIGVFDPSRDHSAAALRGFPCLQHVTFAPTSEGLNVNAFYALQYLVERAYGNYLGLCGLGRFVAHEMNIPLARVTCFTGIAVHEVPKKETRGLLSVLEKELSEDAGSAAR